VPVGEWRTLTVDWSRPGTVACRLCGRPLFGRAWRVELGGEHTDFCDPGCETVFHAYWLPRYGPAAAPER
jgi:hypothetical protein